MLEYPLCARRGRCRKLLPRFHNGHKPIHYRKKNFLDGSEFPLVAATAPGAKGLYSREEPRFTAPGCDVRSLTRNDTKLHPWYACTIAENELALNAGWNERVLPAEPVQLEREFFSLLHKQNLTTTFGRDIKALRIGTWVFVEIDYQYAIAVGARASPTMTNILGRLVERFSHRVESWR